MKRISSALLLVFLAATLNGCSDSGSNPFKINEQADAQYPRILGVINFGDSNPKDFMNALDARRCTYRVDTYDNLVYSVRVPSGCFSLPGNPTVTAFRPKGVPYEITHIYLEPIGSFDTYYKALQKNYSNPNIIIKGHNNPNGPDIAIWKKKGVVIVLQYPTRAAQGSLSYYTPRYYDQEIKSLYEASSTNELNKL